VASVLVLKETSRDLVIEVARALRPYFPDLTSHWREQLTNEVQLGSRALMALERLNIATGCSYFCHGDFAGFDENLEYFSRRLAKLQVDTRVVARSLELYQSLCAPYLGSLFGARRAEAFAALEAFSSATYVAVTGEYFDTKTREATTLLSILDAELSAPDLDSLLPQVLDIATQCFEASMGAILLRDTESETLRLSCVRGVGIDKANEEEYSVAMGQGFTGTIAQTGEPSYVLDVEHDARVQAPALRRAARSLWGVPMKTDAGVIGVLVIGFDKPFEWLPTERELLRAIADRTGLAITRARTADALREREARIAELSAHLLKATEEERKHISRELHDETGQGLMVIRLYLGMLETAVAGRTPRQKIRETLTVVDRTIEGLRRIIGRLSPLVLQELGLVAAVRKEAKDLARNTGVKARVAVPDTIGRLAPETEAAIYRIVQEALHNVAKHAQAKTVNIQMARDNDSVRLLVEDDGVGFAPSRSNSRGHSFGLAGIKERVGMLGGTVRITSGKGKGTRIEISVPAHEVPKAVPATASASAQARVM
jgi:signal transduction histidine kinase